jgi:lysozyme
MNTSQAGIDAIKDYEGVRLKAYDDGVGVWTIGVGHTKGVHRGDVVTMDQVDEFLRADLEDAEDAVNNNVKVPLTQGQFDSLVSWTFNLGGGALRSSTMLKLLNQKKYQEAADQMLLWSKAGGRVLPGLVKRRAAERAMFLSEGRP